MAYFQKIKSGWRFTIDVGRDPLTGKRKQITRSGFKKKGDAEEEAARLKKEYKTKQKTSLSFTELFQLWSDSNPVRDSSLSQRTYSIQKHILPYFAKKKIEKITPMDIQNYILHLKNKGELSNNSIINVRSYLSGILSKAVDLDIISKNPVANVKMRKEKVKKIAWTVEESKYFLTFSKERSRYWMAYYLALYTGMRIGEICTLRYSDIEDGNIQVNRTATQVNGRWKLGPPKTDGSERVFPINKSLQEAIEEWAQYKEDDWLFSGKNQFIIPNTIRNDFIKLNKLSNLPIIDFHDMRATHITMLLDDGVPPQVIARRVGHSDISTMFNKYSRVHDSRLKESSDKIEDILKMW